MRSTTSLLSRRGLMLSAGGLLVTGPFAVTATAQRRGSGDVSADELLKPGDVPDMVIGNVNAKVTIVEYASLTCPACATFHRTVMPTLKEKYIDTGKVRFILRVWPRDTRDAAGYMLALCAGGEKSYLLTSALLDRQQDWAFTQGSPKAKLLEIGKQAGFTTETFDKCLSDTKLLEQVTAARERAANVFSIEQTPTFFINGKRLVGGTAAEFDRILEPLLKSS
jgi:protein-disulfide isomerase